MEPNLGRLLVHNFQLNECNLKMINYNCCSILNCKTCNLADKSYFIKINNFFSIPVFINSNCNSTGIVYIIKCYLCPDFFYIGESGKSIKCRMSGHFQR